MFTVVQNWFCHKMKPKSKHLVLSFRFLKQSPKEGLHQKGGKKSSVSDAHSLFYFSVCIM